MFARLLAIVLMLLASLATAQVTVTAPGGVTVDLDGSSTISIAVSNATDLDVLAVVLNYDPGLVSYVDGSATVVTARFETGEFIVTEPGPGQVRLLLDVGFDFGTALASGSGAVFELDFDGMLKGQSSLTWSSLQAFDPGGEETVTGVDGDLTVLGPGPPTFSPGTGIYSESQTVTVNSADATAIHYTITLDGDGVSDPTTADPSIAPGGTVLVPGVADGDVVTLKVLAVDDDGRSETGEQVYTFDLFPWVTVTPVATPRNTAVDSVEIVFSEAVNGMSLNEVTLTRDGSGNLLDGTATLSTTDNTTFVLSGLNTFTVAVGSYELTVGAAPTAIEDISSQGLLGPDAINWTMDLTPPVVTVDALTINDDTPPLSGLVDNSAVSVSVTVDGQTLPATIPGDGSWTLADNLLTALPENTYDVVVTATDAAGNDGTDDSVNELVIDLTAPTGLFTIEADNPGFVGSTSVTLVNSIQGAAEMRFRKGGDTFGGFVTYEPTKSFELAASEGLQTVTGQFRDAAGNVFETTDAVTVDLTAPTSTIDLAATAGPETWIGLVSGGATDAGSGVAKVTVTIQRSGDGLYWNGSSWVSGPLGVVASGTTSWSVALPLDQLQDGVSYSVSSTAQDTAGNAENPATAAVMTFDDSAPTANFTIAVGDPQFVQDGSIDLIIDAGDATQMRFRNSGESFGAWLNVVATLAWDLSAGDGLRTVEGEFRDSVRNVTPAADTVTVDATAPVSSPTTTGGFSASSWPGLLQATASDATSGVASVTMTLRRQDGLYWTGSSWGAETQLAALPVDANWQIAIDATALDDLGNGITYTVSSIATDAAGNQQGTAGTNTFVFDSSVPTGSFTIGVGNPQYTTTQSVTLAIAVSSGNPVMMQFANDGDAFTTEESLKGSRSWVLPSGDGSFTVTGRFRDTVNDATLTVTDSIIVDTGAPAVAVDNLVNLTTYGPSTWPGVVGGTASDGISGIGSVSVSVQRANDGHYWDGANFVSSGSAVFVTATGAENWSLPLPTAAMTQPGSYLISVKTTDVAGNEATGSGLLVFYDNNPPTGSFSIGVGNPEFLAGVETTLENTVSDADEMRFRNDGAGFGEWEDYETSKVWVLPGGEGAKTVYAEFRDAFGNVLAVTDGVSLDGTAPTSSIALAAISSPSEWNGEITGGYADAGSGVAAVAVTVLRESDGFYWDGSDWQDGDAVLAADLDGGAWDVALAEAALADGEIYRVSATATDLVGNQQAPAATRAFAYDATAPVATPTPPAILGPVGWSGGLPGVASDDRAGVANVSVALVRDDNRVWNGSTWVLGFPQFLAASGTDSWSLAIDLSAFENGRSYTMAAMATDAVGNVQSPAGEATFGFDDELPVVTMSTTAISPNNLSRWAIVLEANETVSFDLGDLSVVNGAVSGLAELTAGTKWQFEVTPAGDGDVVVTVDDGAVNDLAGNAAASTSLTRVSDRTAPQLTVANEQASPTKADPVTFLVSSDEPVVTELTVAEVTATGGTVQSVEAVSAGSSWRVTVTPDADGTVTLVVPAEGLTDVAGNGAARGEGTVVSDQTAPVVTITRSPDQDRHNGDYELTVNADDGSIEYALNSGSFEAYLGSVTVTDEGDYVFKAQSTDAAGNVGTAEVAFEIDLTGPVMAFAAPTAGAPVNGTAFIAFSNDDKNNPELSIDGVNWYAPVEVPTLGDFPQFTGSDGFAELPEGAFTLRVRDADALGNEGTAEVNLIKDTVAPVVTISSNAPGGPPASESSTSLVVTLSSDGGEAISYQVDGGSVTAYDEPFPLTAVGTYVVTAAATDPAGNEGTVTVGGLKVGHRLAGTVTYDGAAAGTIRVEVVDVAQDLIVAAGEPGASPAAYDLVVPATGTFLVRAYLDQDTGDEYDLGEPVDADTAPNLLIDDEVSPLDLVIADWAVDYQLLGGWNLLSVPGEALNGNEPSMVWPSARARVTRWVVSERRYVSGTTALAGLQGAWVWAPGAETVRVRGNYGILLPTLVDGWNLVGVAQPVTLSTFSDVVVAYRWDGRRMRLVVDQETLVPGVGYWIFRHAGE